MLSRTRRLTRRRRFLTGLVLGFAMFVALGSMATAQVRPYEPQADGVVTKAPHDANLSVAIQSPDFSHLPSEDRAAIFAPAQQAEHAAPTASGSGLDTGDWMRGLALAALLIAASAFGLTMVRGAARTAHS